MRVALMMSIGACVGLGGVDAAQAQVTAEARQDAIEIVKQANALYDDGKFAESLPLYREAYSLLDDVRLLYRIGLNYENLSNFQRAREYLEDYLRLDPHSQYAGRIQAKIERLGQMERTVQAFLDVRSDPTGARVYLNGDLLHDEGRTPVRVPVGVGEQTVTLVFDNRQRLEDIVLVEPGKTVERVYRVEGGPAAAAPPRAAAADTTSIPTAADAARGGDGAAVAAGPTAGTTPGTGKGVGPGVDPAIHGPGAYGTYDPGLMHSVDLAPPDWALGTGWAAVAVGTGLGLAGIWTRPSLSVVGAALVGGGVYMLAFHDWGPGPEFVADAASHPALPELPRVRGASVSISF